ncbi:unnamed protein product [Auanema sp. JU1783]|nr:unnamed protein product [Auanema sp. JU1783]
MKTTPIMDVYLSLQIPPSQPFRQPFSTKHLKVIRVVITLDRHLCLPVERLDAPIEKIGMDVLDEDLNITYTKNLDDFASEISQMKDSSEIEECMGNRDKLPEEVIRRIKNQIQRLSRLIKKLTKQQRQYCISNIASPDQESVNIIEYR